MEEIKYYMSTEKIHKKKHIALTLQTCFSSLLNC